MFALFSLIKMTVLIKNFPSQVEKGSFIPESFVYKLAFKASNKVSEY